MKIVKDESLSLLCRVFQVGPTHRLGVTVLAGFTLSDPPGLLEEGDFWEIAAKALDRHLILDQGMPKPQGEVLLAGLAFAPDGRPVTGIEVGLSVGTLRKTLTVFGDRIWQGLLKGDSTSPQPFTVMPLTWDRAFGGPDYPANPEGRGMEDVRTASGQLIRPRPNIEYAQEITQGPKDRPRPAGFNPEGLTWPAHLKNLGNFGTQWLREQWPGLPEDFNWGYFNQAPSDQRWPGFFQGDEPLECLNMHPDRPRLVSRLPGRRLRLLTVLGGEQEETWQELTPKLDTVWLWPHLDAGALIWHATQPVADQDAAEVVSCVAALELLAESPKPAEYYLDPKPAQAEKAPLPVQEEKRPAPAAAAAFVEAEPPTRDPKIEEALRQTEAEIKDQEARLEDLLREHGLDPKAALPPVELPPETAQYLTKSPPLSAELSPGEILEQVRREEAEIKNRLNNLLQSHGVDPDSPVDPTPPSMPTMLEALAALKTLPGPEAEQAVETMEHMERMKQETETEVAGLAREVEKREAEQAKSGAEPGLAQAKDETSPHPLTRELVLRGHAEGLDFRGRDLSGLDLSGCCLDGIRLAGAILEKTDFSRSSLKNSDLSGAILTGADLSQTDLTSASLKEAKAPATNLSRAKIGRADLGRAVFIGADLTEADLTEAHMDQADCSQALLGQANLGQIQAMGACFAEARLDGADLTGADLTASDFSQAGLERARLAKANLTSAWLPGVRAQGADLEEANLQAAKSQGGASFIGANLIGANLSQSYFADVDFSDADFTAARLQGASLIRCSLKGATLRRTDARRADMSESDLSGANLSLIDLAEGSLRRARLNGTDLRLANLFAVDVYQSKHQDTNLNGANLKRTLLGPRQD